MREERLRILKMIEEEKISVDDATKLLDALKNSHVATGKEMDMYQKVASFSESVEQFAKDVGERVNETYKSMEPKLKSATKKMVEKTAGVIDDISESLNKSLASWEDEDIEICDQGPEAEAGDDEEAPADKSDTNLPN